MDLGQLKLLASFAIVVEEGSFAGAARRIGTSRSRISEQVSDLETRLGVRLLHRSTRKVSMTEDGRLVFEKARKLRSIMDDVDELVNQTHPKGRVTLTVAYDVGITRLLPVLPAFEALYPEIQLDLVLSDEKTDLISEQVDLAIRIGIPKDESIISRVLNEEYVGFFASPKFLEREGVPSSPADMEKMRWILLRQINTNRSVKMLHDQKGIHVIQPSNYHQCNAPIMLREMIEQGMGVGNFLPSLAYESVQNGRMVRILSDWHGPSLTFALNYSSRRQMPTRTRLLIDYLVKSDIFTISKNN